MSQVRDSHNESSQLLDRSNTQDRSVAMGSPEDGEEEKPISFFQFFKYLSVHDKCLLYIGTAASIIAGMILPSISLIMGNVTAAFTGGGGASHQAIIDEMNFIASYVIMISVGLFITSYIFFAFWSNLAENIVIDLRKRYMKALMRQEIAFFEKNNVEQIPVQMAEVFETVRSAIGEKFSTLIFAIATCLSGIGYAFWYGPIFTLVCLAYLPFLLGILGGFGTQVKKSALDKLNVTK